MRVEAKKSFQHGFVLSEQELRRFVNVIREQIEKTSPDKSIVEYYEVKFRNGVIAEKLSLDDVLSQENIGSRAIVRLKIEISEKVIEPGYTVITEFRKANEEGEEENISIRYCVVGDDRDWVFVTSSELEERIKRNKKINIARYTRFELFLPTLTLFTIIPMMVNLLSSLNKSNIYIDKIETAWKSGELTDPIEAMIALERVGVTDRVPTEIVFKPIGIGVLVFVILILVVWGIQYFFAPFNFCWGDYIKVYEKKQAQGKFIFITVILLSIIVPICISIISSLIQNSIGF